MRALRNAEHKFPAAQRAWGRASSTSPWLHDMLSGGPGILGAKWTSLGADLTPNSMQNEHRCPASILKRNLPAFFSSVPFPGPPRVVSGPESRRERWLKHHTHRKEFSYYVSRRERKKVLKLVCHEYFWSYVQMPIKNILAR